MAVVVKHLGVEELQDRYRGSSDVTLSRHYQVIWLLAQGRSLGGVARLTSFAVRWVEQLLARYNALGPSSPGDRRRGNGAPPSVLTPALLGKLRERLAVQADVGEVEMHGLAPAGGVGGTGGALQHALDEELQGDRAIDGEADIDPLRGAGGGGERRGALRRCAGRVHRPGLGTRLVNG